MLEILVFFLISFFFLPISQHLAKPNPNMVRSSIKPHWGSVPRREENDRRYEDKDTREALEPVWRYRRDTIHTHNS